MKDLRKGVRHGKMRKVQEYLEKIGEGALLFCPNPGNAGDSAIALGTYQLLERAERPYEVVRWDEDFSSAGKVVVYGGGGNLGKSTYTEARTFFRRHHSEAAHMALLPHTVRGNERLLLEMEGDVDIFCRERVSYNWVRRHVNDQSVHLADDMAFRIDADRLLDRHGPSATALWLHIARGIGGSALGRVPGCDPELLTHQVRGRLGVSALLRLVQGIGAHRSVLPAMRTDVERTDHDVPPVNVDASRIFEHGVFPPSRARKATVFLLAYLSHFERIFTNRLHLGILGALLGKEVRFYPNSYYKNRAVYRFSMAERFPNVSWEGG